MMTPAPQIIASRASIISNFLCVYFSYVRDYYDVSVVRFGLFEGRNAVGHDELIALAVDIVDFDGGVGLEVLA